MAFYFYRGCEECGRGVDIETQICSKCGFDFTLHPRINPKCPYCEKDLHITDFCVADRDKKGRKILKGLLGEYVGSLQMFHCPFC